MYNDLVIQINAEGLSASKLIELRKSDAIDDLYMRGQFDGVADGKLELCMYLYNFIHNQKNG
jgi:hypothetical protein